MTSTDERGAMPVSSGKLLELSVGGKTYRVRVQKLSLQRAVVEVNGKNVEVGFHEIEAPHTVPVQKRPAAEEQPAQPPVSVEPIRSQASNPNTIMAPLPGIIRSLSVTEGALVSSGDVVLVLEAMKMENEIRAGRSGTIGKIHVSVGQRVKKGDPLFSFAS
jgi:glutaconyl-CoA/methylmalonyl-CoA decarboxylase subunit gamma